jgi:nucleotide-binding universal stress UspA family protein
MTRNGRSEIVVGIDGSPEALNATRWAAAEATARHFGVVLVRALPWPFIDVPLGPDLDGAIETQEREAAGGELTEAEAMLRAVTPDLNVRWVMDLANPAQLLFDASDRAAMIVIGSRGRNSLMGTLAGSAAVQVASHSTVPVVVVRGDRAPGGNVVVGVDGSPDSAEAIAFAFDVAARRNAPLVAVHTWSHPISTGPGDMLPLVVKMHQEAEDRMVAEALAGWAEKYPDVVVTRQVSRGHPAHALVDASAGAQLTVIGSRGHGGFAGLLLGSVGLSLLHHARCPVAVVRTTETGRGDVDE